jgi:hypothetical protein
MPTIIRRNDADDATEDQGYNKKSRHNTSGTAGLIRNEDDEDDVTDGTNKQGRMTTMVGMTETIPPATGTLDRKTSQASPTACLYNNNQHKKTREA